MTPLAFETGAKAQAQHEIAVFAADVPDRQVLLDGLRPGVVSVALSGAEDGLRDLAALLDGVNGLGALHILSHGAPGRLFLGAVPLTAQTLAANGPLLQKIGSALAVDGAVLLYGCEVAKGTEGRAFVAALQDALGRDVVASATPTGAADRGGDWRLGDADGAAFPPLIGQATQQDYAGLLVGLTPTTYLVTNNNLTGEGSLGEAITDANGNPGADRIEFTEGFTIQTAGSEFYIQDELVIDGDIDNDGIADVTLQGDGVTSSHSALFNVFGYDVAVTIEGLVFEGLLSEYSAAAINIDGMMSHGVTLNVTGSEFRDLTSSGGGYASGGAIHAGYHNTVNVDRSIFSNVTQTGQGAVIGMEWDSAINVTNSLFYENTVGKGVIHASGSDAKITLRNVTSTDNTSALSITPTVATESGATAAAYNSLLDSTANFDLRVASNTASTDDFADRANENYRLAENAIWIDDGDNGSVSRSTEFDLLGAPRIQNGIVDLGAYEGAAVAPNSAPVFDGDADDNAVIDTTLTVVEDSGATSLDTILGVTDADGGDALTWSVVSGPKDGTLGGFDGTGTGGEATGSTVTPSGLTYTPDADFNGTDSFEVQVSDGTDTDNMTVNVTVTGAPDVEGFLVADGTFGIGDSVMAAVGFDGPVTVDTNGGLPTLQLDVGGTLRQASYFAYEDDAVIFAYPVTADDADDAYGIAITANGLSLNGATITDFEGNAADITHAGFSASGATVDATRPTVTVSLDDAALIAGEAATVTFQFSEDVTGFTLDGVTAANGDLSDFVAIDGNTYTATLTPAADTEAATNAVTVDMTGVLDAADNAGTGSTDSANYTVDTRAPTVAAIVREAPADATTDADSVTFRVTFSEAMAPATVALADFLLSGTAAADATVDSVTQVSGDPSAYDVTFTGIASSNGTLNLDLASEPTLTDAAGNALTNVSVTGADETYTIANNNAPVFEGDGNNDGVIDTTLTVVEDSGATSIDAILGAADADDGDELTWSVVSGPTGGTLGGFDGSGATGMSPGDSILPFGLSYTPNADFSGDDSFVVQVSDGTDTDTMTVDVTVTNVLDVRDIIVSKGIHGTYGIGDIIYATVYFDGLVMLDTAGGTPTLELDIGGTLRQATIDHTGEEFLGFRYMVTADDVDDLDITVPANALSLNGATITGTDGTAADITHDAVTTTGAIVDTPPTVTITLDDAALTAGETATVTFQFSEDVMGFSLADATAANGILSGLVAVDAAIYTATLTPAADTEDATNVVTVDMTGVSDTTINAGMGTTDSANYTVDSRAPTVTSILRQSPGDATTDADSVTFRVTFSEDMAPGTIELADFELSGTAAGDATVDSVTQVSGDPSAYDVTFTGIASSNGTLNLDLVSEPTLTDAAGNALTNVSVTGADETYTIANNTAPSISTNKGAALDEGASLTIGTTDLAATDAEQDAAALSYTLDTATANGTLWLDDGDDTFEPGEELTADESFTQADIDSGHLRYSHDGSETTTDSFSFAVSDGTATLAPQTFKLSIAPVNDAPTVALLNTVTEIDEDTDTSEAIRVGTIRITDDALGANTLSLSGSDANLFEIDGRALFLRAGAALDFETNPVLDVTVNVSDSSIPASSGASLSINVTDVNEAPEFDVTQTRPVLPEGYYGPERTAVATVDVIDDGLGTNMVALDGEDAKFFQLEDNTLFLKAGLPLASTLMPMLDVELTVDDPTLGAGPEDSLSLSFLVPDTTQSGRATDDLLIGTAYGDVLSGYGGNDTLVGLQGDDLLDGGAGTGDVAVFTGPAERYTIVMSSDGVIVTDRREDGDGSDTLIDVETIRFAADPAGDPDAGTDFDLDSYAGAINVIGEQIETITQFYIGLFDRVPDAQGLFFWATKLAEGVPEDVIADAFIDSPEATAIYGAAPTSSEIVTGAYQNLLDRDADLAGSFFWTSLLEQGILSPAQFFTQFAAGVEAPTGSSADRTTLDDQTDIGIYFSAIKGLSDVGNASEALAVYDLNDRNDSLDEAKDLIDDFATEATSTGSDAFLIQITGIIDDPFASIA